MKTPIKSIIAASAVLFALTATLAPVNASHDIKAFENLSSGNSGSLNRKNNSGQTPLHQATRTGKTEFVRAFIEAGVELDTRTSKGKRETALHIAARLRHTDILQMLIDSGADLNKKDKQDGWTPLHAAVYHQQLESIKTLIAAGAKLNVKNKYGRTPLAMAKRNMLSKSLTLLMAAGAK